MRSVVAVCCNDLGGGYIIAILNNWPLALKAQRLLRERNPNSGYTLSEYFVIDEWTEETQRRIL